MTLHDCRMLTGGCPYPLECPGWRSGCAVPCPRGYPDAAVVQRAIRESALAAGISLVSPSRWLGRMAAEAFPQLRIRVIPNGVPWPDALLPRAEAKMRVGVAPGGRLGPFRRTWRRGGRIQGRKPVADPLGGNQGGGSPRCGIPGRGRRAGTARRPGALASCGSSDHGFVFERRRRGGVSQFG